MKLEDMNLMKIFSHFETPMTEAHDAFITELMADETDLSDPTTLARFQSLQSTAASIVNSVTGMTKKESDTTASVSNKF